MSKISDAENLRPELSLLKGSVWFCHHQRLSNSKLMELNVGIQVFLNSSQNGYAIAEAISDGTAIFVRSTYGPTLEQQTAAFKVLKILFYSIILLGSTMGNGLVIFIIASNSQMRSSSNILILNLAVCDFITPVFSIPFHFVLEENENVWFLGNATCKILWPSTEMTSTSAALTLASISLDRYRTIMHPFKSRLTILQIKWIIGAIYFFSFLIISPYFFTLSLDGLKCREIWPSVVYKKYYTLTLAVLQYFAPLSFMVAMYTLALKHLYVTADKTSRGKTQNEKAVINNSEMVNAIASPDLGKSRKMATTPRLIRKLSSTMRRGTNEANKRATKMFLAIVVVFTICMVPNQALKIWLDFSGVKATSAFLKAVIIGCRLLTYSNSVCNPVIYAVFSRDFRRGFENVLKKVFCICSHCESNSLRTKEAVELIEKLKGAVRSDEMIEERRKMAVSATRHALAAQYVTGV